MGKSSRSILKSGNRDFLQIRVLLWGNRLDLSLKSENQDSLQTRVIPLANSKMTQKCEILGRQIASHYGEIVSIYPQKKSGLSANSRPTMGKSSRSILKSENRDFLQIGTRVIPLVF